LKYIKAALIYYREFGMLLTLQRIVQALADKLLFYIAVLTSFGLVVNVLYLRFCIGFSKSSSVFIPVAEAKRNRTPLVGLLYLGGIGDSLFLSALAAAVIKKYPDAKVFAFVREESHAELFLGSDLISGVYAVHPNKVDLLNQCLIRIFDVVLEDRYVIKTVNKFATNKERTDTEAAFRSLVKNWDIFPLHNYLYGETGNSLFDLASRCTGLNVVEDDLTIPLLSAEFESLAENLPDIPPYGYITVHHGSDPRMILPDGSRAVLQSKNWFTDRWEEVINGLSIQGYVIVQVGLEGEQPLKNCVNLLGKLSIRKTAAILKYAVLHLDTEGGVVHLARAVNTRSVVLFGPTPLTLYRYRDNINIAEGDCRNCFWSDIRWFQRCPKGYVEPLCMEAISPARVNEAVSTLLHADKRRLPTAELLDLSLFNNRFPEEQLDTLKDIYRSADIDFKGVSSSSHNLHSGSYVHASKNWEYLYVLNAIKEIDSEKRIIDVGAGRGALQVYLSGTSWDVSSVDLSFSEHLHDGHECRHTFLKTYGGKIHFRFGSIFNLPFPDNHFDVVVSVSVIEHLKNKEFALYELLRVLKPGGLLVLTYDITRQETLSESADDTNRIEIFTPESIETCMASVGVATGQPDISGALEQMRLARVEGIPPSMTVGGITLRKS
jgi:ADP-heptose:LPS heptosyltransferase/SAM-dependent methyltransferase